MAGSQGGKQVALLYLLVTAVSGDCGTAWSSCHFGSVGGQAMSIHHENILGARYGK